VVGELSTTAQPFGSAGKADRYPVPDLGVFVVEVSEPVRN
jgi:hypothetical protein